MSAETDLQAAAQAAAERILASLLGSGDTSLINSLAVAWLDGYGAGLKFADNVVATKVPE
jgi:hypothetical protein